MPLRGAAVDESQTLFSGQLIYAPGGGKQEPSLLALLATGCGSGAHRLISPAAGKYPLFLIVVAKLDTL